MCSQHNVRVSAGDNTGQYTDKRHTPNPRIQIKIPDPTGNRTRAAGLEGRDSTDHATATDLTTLLKIVSKLWPEISDLFDAWQQLP